MKGDLVRDSVLQVLKKNAGTGLLLLAAVCGVVTASLIPPQILKRVIDQNLVPGNKDGLLLLAGAYMAVLLLIGLFDFLKEAVLTVLGQKITKEIRLKMMEKLERINVLYFSSHESGSVASRFINDVDAVNSMFTSGIAGLFIDCFKVIGIVASIWLFSGRLGVITLLLLPVIFVITRLFQRRMLSAQMKNRVLVGQVNNHIAESIKNVRMIKSFSKEAYMEEIYKDCLMENYRTVEKVNFYDSVFSPIIQLTRAFVIGLIVVLSSGQLHFLGISLGMVAASIDLISNLFAPIENLGMELQNIQYAISGIRRVNEFYSEPEDECGNKRLTAFDILPDRNDVRLSFHDLSFSYDDETEVLENVSLDIAPREKVTFTGRTGVGKTTLFKLIMGLMRPSGGSVTLNGIDVCDIPNSEKRRIFGYVDQGFHLIKGTVADQITLQDTGISREQVQKALDFVGLTEAVASMEKGMDTIVSGESSFSYGQKQLLSIARAIVTDPPILLLDEITSNLDSITEEKIVSVLRKAGSSRTILSISHRLSTMVASDIVVILENGRVRNSGSPEQLLQKDDWYRSHIALEKLTWG